MIFQIRDGLHYNPYFPGGAIAMPKMLNDEAVEYEDGTPATEAQVCVTLFFFVSVHVYVWYVVYMYACTTIIICLVTF